MAYYGKAANLPKDGERYGCNCVDGKCSGCGECCVDLLPMTPNEIQRIKAYVAKHHLKEHRQAPFFDPRAVDLSCPFRNQRTRKCDIYSVSPYICRTFICTKTKEDAVRDRDVVHRDRRVHSLRWEVFRNGESLGFILAAAEAASNK